MSGELVDKNNQDANKLKIMYKQFWEVVHILHEEIYKPVFTTHSKNFEEFAQKSNVVSAPGGTQAPCVLSATGSQFLVNKLSNS